MEKPGIENVKKNPRYVRKTPEEERNFKKRTSIFT